MIDKTTGRWSGRIWFHANRMPQIPSVRMKLTDEDKAHGWQEMHVMEVAEPSIQTALGDVEEMLRALPDIDRAVQVIKLALANEFHNTAVPLPDQTGLS